MLSTLKIAQLVLRIEVSVTQIAAPFTVIQLQKGEESADR